MITGDGAYIKKLNRSLILKKIVEKKSISRADLSKITGLNKATISVQVADLLNDDLVRETYQEHNFVGRRPIMLSINETAGYVLGIDLDYKNIQFVIADLNGQPIQYKSLTPETTDYDEIAYILIENIQKYKKQYETSKYGLISVNIGIHGTVTNDQHIQFVPAYNWKDKNLKEDLQKKVSIDISIHNNANLSAYAERVYNYPESKHLLNIIMSSGIGVGYMVNGQIQTGYNGFAGEMGHMIIKQDGEACNCGNHGCWERYSSEKSLFEKLQKQLNVNHLTYDELNSLILTENPIVTTLFEQYIIDLSIGLNNIINLYNPETLVLTNEMLSLYPNAIEKIKTNLTSTVSHYGSLELSTFNRTSCAIGGCAIGIQSFLDIPEIFLTRQNKIQ